MRFQPLFLVGTDVVFLLRKFARFTREEAEKCRKYISKMMPERFDYAERFVTGCMENSEFRVGTLVQGDVATGGSPISSWLARRLRTERDFHHAASGLRGKKASPLLDDLRYNAKSLHKQARRRHA